MFKFTVLCLIMIKRKLNLSLTTCLTSNLSQVIIEQMVDFLFLLFANLWLSFWDDLHLLLNKDHRYYSFIVNLAVRCCCWKCKTWKLGKHDGQLFKQQSWIHQCQSSWSMDHFFQSHGFSATSYTKQPSHSSIQGFKRVDDELKTMYM